MHRLLDRIPPEILDRLQRAACVLLEVDSIKKPTPSVKASIEDAWDFLRRHPYATAAGVLAGAGTFVALRTLAHGRRASSRATAHRPRLASRVSRRRRGGSAHLPTNSHTSSRT